jgi:hypothetical protein
MSNAAAVALLITLFSIGFGVMSYKGQALARGWSIGEWFANDASWIKILGFVSWTSAAVMAFRWLNWPLAIGVIVAGVIGAFLLTNILKSMFQWLAVLLIPLSMAARWYLGII